MGEGETAALTQNGNGSASPENGCDNDGLIVAPIQVIIPVDLSDAEDDSDVEEVKPKKKMQKKKKKAEKKKVDPSEVIVRTFGQALRLINEQKVRIFLFTVRNHVKLGVFSKDTYSTVR